MRKQIRWHVVGIEGDHAVMRTQVGRVFRDQACIDHGCLCHLKTRD